MAQQPNQKHLANKLARHLQQDNHMMRAHLGSEMDYAKYLAARRDGVSICGDAPELD
jgi:hypothetical protein